ncbi:hypothetical protein AHAS_Ahas19G0151900 [Arachis hypogaea]
MICGVADGAAAAFCASVGGVLFALEEATSWTFFTTTVVAIVLTAAIQLCATRKCGLFGEGGLIMYDVGSSKVTYSAGDILVAILLGVIGGVLGINK